MLQEEAEEEVAEEEEEEEEQKAEETFDTQCFVMNYTALTTLKLKAI